MTRKRMLTLRRRLPALAVFPIALALLVLPVCLCGAEETPLLEYGVDVVTTYVSQGEDFFRSAYDTDGKKHAAFPLTPAAQPYVTLHGPSGISLGLWGSYALTQREPDPDRNFAGLETLDEVDYTLAWSWDNRLGAYTAGWALYTYTNVASRGSLNELFFSIAPKALESIGGKLTHWVGADATGGGYTYTQLAIGGGDTLTWNLYLGQAVKPKDLTARLGYAFGDLSVSVNAAYRPNPELVGYNEDGTYTVNGATEHYPPTVVWLSVGYGGQVAP